MKPTKRKASSSSSSSSAAASDDQAQPGHAANDDGRLPSFLASLLFLYLLNPLDYVPNFNNSPLANAALRKATQKFKQCLQLTARPPVSILEIFSIRLWTESFSRGPQSFVRQLRNWLNNPHDHVDELKNQFSFLCLLEHAYRCLRGSNPMNDKIIYCGDPAAHIDFNVFERGRTIIMSYFGRLTLDIQLAMQDAGILPPTKASRKKNKRRAKGKNKRSSKNSTSSAAASSSTYDSSDSDSDSDSDPSIGYAVLYELRNAPVADISGYTGKPRNREAMLGFFSKWRIDSIAQKTHERTGKTYIHVVLSFKSQPMWFADKIDKSLVAMFRGLDCTPKVDMDCLNCLMSTMMLWCPQTVELVNACLREQPPTEEDGSIVLFDAATAVFYIDANNAGHAHHIGVAGHRHISTVKAALVQATRNIRELLQFTEHRPDMRRLVLRAITQARIFSLQQLAECRLIPARQRPAGVSDRLIRFVAASFPQGVNVHDGQEIDPRVADRRLLRAINFYAVRGRQSWLAYVQSKWYMVTRTAAASLTLSEIPRVGFSVVRACRPGLTGAILASADFMAGAEFGISLADLGASAAVFVAQASMALIQYARGDMTLRQAGRAVVTAAASVASSVAGASLGGSAGSFVGSVLFPGLGTVIGGILGSVIGSLIFGMTAHTATRVALEHLVPDGKEEEAITRRQRFYHAIRLVNCHPESTWAQIKDSFVNRILRYHPDKIRQIKRRPPTEQELDTFTSSLVAWRFVQEYWRVLVESLGKLNLPVTANYNYTMEQVDASWRHLSTRQRADAEYKFAYFVLQQHATEPQRRSDPFVGFFDLFEPHCDFSPDHGQIAGAIGPR